jgi:DNA polymerase I-like protein with 3'-5' exonuclease and polymerase domains
MDTLTGFRCSGLIGRNDCINYPVQGSAFHCLLWSLIRLNRWLRTQKKQTQIIAQIHDSIVMYTAPEEAEEVIAMTRRIMCEDIRRVWPWIITPLEIEAEITPVDSDWSTKKEFKP